MPKPKVVIVDGARTPFARHLSNLAGLSAVDLGRVVTEALLSRYEDAEIERVIFGFVVPVLSSTNVARDIVLSCDMARQTDANSVSKACLSGYQSLVDIVFEVRRRPDIVGIAGGCDSPSHAPIGASSSLTQKMRRFGRTDVKNKLKLLASLRPTDLMPAIPEIKDAATGLSMGDATQLLAAEDGISRQAQDQLAMRSHERAAAAYSDGRLHDDIVMCGEPLLARDNTVRGKQSAAAYGKLPPLFPNGTLTAGNCAPISDGASALLVTSQDKAQSLGVPVLARVVDWHFVAVDPATEMLMGPAYAAPIVLARNKLTMKDIGLIDIHEAFAAQVLSVERRLASQAFVDDKGLPMVCGEFDWEKTNVTGGSLAIGHPFAATGGRQVMQLARELKRQGGGLGLSMACGMGGLGVAMLIEVDA